MNNLNQFDAETQRLAKLKWQEIQRARIEQELFDIATGIVMQRDRAALHKAANASYAANRRRELEEVERA